MSQQKRPVLWKTQPKLATSPRTSSSAPLKRPPILLLKKPDHTENTIPASPDEQFDKAAIASRSKNSPKKKKAKNISSPTSIGYKPAPSPQELQARRKAKISHYGRRIGSAKSIPDKSLLASPPAATKRCGWITSDPVMVSYHDQEWGVPVHDDKLIFELLTLASAQSELSWSALLRNRESYRAAFSGFDPSLIAAYDASRIAATRSSIDILRQEGRVETVVENARRTLQICHEFGSLDRYVWGFVNHKPIVTSFRMSSQVPIKSARSEVMSKDLIQRGFRGVAPAIVYSFMQAAGLTNDHTVHCFRHKQLASHHLLHSI